MHKQHNYLVGILVATGLAAGVGLAVAQTPPPPDGAMHHDVRHEHRPFSMPSERLEARLAYIKTALKITDAQRPQWDAYADAMRSQARDDDKRMNEWHSDMEKRMDEHKKDGAADKSAKGDWTPPTAIERLEHEREFLKGAETRLDATIAAEKPLYAALSPEQKRVADEVLNDEHHGHGGHGMKGHGGPGRMGHEGKEGHGGW